MKSIFIALLMIYSISAFGQTHFLGIKGGINWSNVDTDVSIYSNRDNRIGFSGGLTYEYHFKKPYFVAGADLLYAQKGFRIEKYFPNEGENVGGNLEIINNYNYLSLPLKGGVVIGEKITGFVMLGLVPSRVIKAESILSLQFSDGRKDEINTDIIDKVTKIDFAGLAEIGGSILIGGRLFIITSLVYQRSFTTITNSNYIPNNEVRHYNTTLSIGLKYALKNE